MTDNHDATAPAYMHVLSPHLVCAGAADAIAFYKAAFDATEMIRLAGPDGKLMHASICVNGSSVMLVDENPAFGMLSPKSLKGSPVTIHLIVKDVDAVVRQATDRGPLRSSVVGGDSAAGADDSGGTGSGGPGRDVWCRRFGHCLTLGSRRW
jgi:uncharacterized glyoxalase superfamily protein PhnB